MGGSRGGFWFRSSNGFFLSSFGTSGQCVFDIVCATRDEILADESTEVHDLGPDLKSD